MDKKRASSFKRKLSLLGLVGLVTLFLNCEYIHDPFLSTRPFDGINLIVNGDFSDGNTGFTSDYQYFASDFSSGCYTVNNNAFEMINYCPGMTDHTGGGPMMIINGGSGAVWRQSITVEMNTYYLLTAYVGTFWPFPHTSIATLSFRINGEEIGTVAVDAWGGWKSFQFRWNSNSATSMGLEIYDLNIDDSGNDFVIDDLSLVEYK